MYKILIATTNKAKFAEITRYLQGMSLELVSLLDVGITNEVLEDGKTYEENAQKKARTYAAISGLPALSDDGGLEIDALGGEPGVNSRYWAGKEGKDEDIIAKMSQIAETLPDNKRGARFRVVLSLALPTGKVWSVTSIIEGEIAKEPLFNVKRGFPYRAFFYLPQIQKYYQDEQLTNDEQKHYNHRYKAIQKLKKILQEEIHI